MENRTFKITLMLVIINSVMFSSGNFKPIKKSSCPYFPASENLTLIYESSFGETIAKFIHNNDKITGSNESKKFKYRQTFIINDTGVFVTETYQFFKVLLLLNKEGTYTYNKPLLRLPLPLIPGKQWSWEGIEYTGNDSSMVKVSGKIFNYETIATKVGTFDALKTETIIEGSDSKNTITEWYVENIGLVKAKIIIGGGGLLSIVRDLLGYGEIIFDLNEIIRE